MLPQNLLPDREVLFEKVRSKKHSNEEKITDFLIETLENCEIRQLNNFVRFKIGKRIYFELHQPSEFQIDFKFLDEISSNFRGISHRYLMNHELMDIIKKAMQKKFGIKNLNVVRGYKGNKQ